MVCYAYLADVPSKAADRQNQTLSPEFSQSEWFNRGWTLQELIAPSVVIFLDQAWQEIGTKSSLQPILSKITSIPPAILQGAQLETASVAQRMSWASKRKTTRVEDLAYCLMGIFGINMPLLYGEEEKAFIRLQEEIIKISDDHSLFAWEFKENHDGGLLATSPVAFSNSGEIACDPSGTLSRVITVNNKGIHLKLPFRKQHQNFGMALLPCTKNGKRVAIILRALSEKQEYFVRILGTLIIFGSEDFSWSRHSEKSICVRQERRIPKNQPSLNRAVARGHEGVINLLLEKGAELEAKDDTGQTPLSRAAAHGQKVVVNLLLEKGAELENKDKSGRTPLQWAAAEGHKVVINLLLEKGAELENKDKSGQTPLFVAACEGHEAVVKLLLDKGAKLETKDESGRTPLSRAAVHGHEAVMKLLLEKGAKLETKDKSGRTPLLWAKKNGHKAIVNLLLEKGAKDESGWTKLLGPIAEDHKAVVRLLRRN